MPESGLPSRRELREALAGFTGTHMNTAVRLLALDCGLFVGALALVVTSNFWMVKLAGSLLTGLAIVRLFILGHDACHQSLTASRKFNSIVGRVVFLPSLTPFSAWEVGHNMAHHAFTNLKGRDHVWAPFTPEEYVNLCGSRRLLERIYRGGFGEWLYYFRELWWKKLFFPSAAEVGGSMVKIRQDSLLVAGFAAMWIAGLVIVALTRGEPPLWNVFFGFFGPFVLWNQVMGFVIYVHHTDPSVPWHCESGPWAASKPHIASTLHVQFPRFIASILHNIMEHPAHHLDFRIPLYRLREAQAALDKVVPGVVQKRRFSLSWYFECVARCKTFDVDRGKWAPFPRQRVGGEMTLATSRDVIAPNLPAMGSPTE